MTNHPGYFDLQVNGYAGVDFNADCLDTQALAAAGGRLRDEGVAGILATVITDHLDAMCNRLANVVRACQEDQIVKDVIWGLHVEGPFLNQEPGYIGAHPPQHAQPADTDSMNRLLEAGDGLVRLVTLAPECDEDYRVTSLLANQGICVSAGHCNPTLDQLRAAIDAGLSMFTHLGNGCPLNLHRHDNIVQRVLSISDQLWVCFIADGVHVPYPALSNYLKCAGPDRSVVVTDAISAAGMGPGEYMLGDQSVIVDERGATWSADRSHLVGSAATMPVTKQNLEQHLNLTADQVEQLISVNPRRALGLGG